MNIRTKMLSLLALLFVVLAVFEIAIQKEVLMPSFAELERDDAKTSMKRISYALDMTLDGLALSATDWGNWADVYQYIERPNAAFLKANISPIALKQLQVDALLIADLRGNLVLSSSSALESGADLDLDVANRKTLPGDFPWRRTLVAGTSEKGLIQTNRGIMMIAAAPVLDGSGGGEAIGTVIMGRLLTPGQVRALGARAQAALSMVQALPMVHNGGRGFGDEVVETEEQTQIYRSFNDIYGRPLMQLRVDVPRKITARGQKAVAYASAYLIGAAVAVLIVLMIVLNRVVLEPLARVTRHAASIGEGADLTARLHLPGRDEIARLAHEFDRMVASVAEGRRQLVDQSFQAGFAELAKGVLHNLGNAMTPVGVRLATLEERLRAAPAADLELACTELAIEQPGSARRADLEEFLRLGCRAMAAAVRDAQADVALVQRQAAIVQSALSELMRSTRNDHIVEAVRLPELVTQTLEIVPDACRQRLIVDADESLAKVGVVRVARMVLRLILQNLIINAADAVRDAGRTQGNLRVAAEIVRESDREQLHLHCRDNGVGIPKDNLQRVFEKGFSTKSRDSNYGIGLHWCANAVAALGGRIWAASEGPGRGASLHLILPLAVQENPMAMKTAEVHP
jgi:two-component system NtrC family sensor kinase